MKHILLTGRLTKDPEVKTVGEKKEAKKVASFTIANNDVDKENAEYFDVSCWEKLAEFAEGYLKKGTKVIITGSYNNETYTDKDGNPRVKFRVTARQIEFAG
ncbi:MAG: single-stranded DNA-binding protein [Ruminococcaceae bacterium]|mgnify:CR=1 FL=1|nr:single-stranded DNA-binding protein [Oscillospiraceae bacterium]